MANPLQSTESAKNAISRVRYNHDAMIDRILEDGAVDQNALAAHFGYSVPWISRVLCSDAFQARLAERKSELIDPTLALTLEEKMRGVVSNSLDVLHEKLLATRSADLALKAIDVTGRALGLGARANQPQAVQNNFIVQVPAKSPSAAEWMAQHGRNAGTILEGQVVQTSAQAQP